MAKRWFWVPKIASSSLVSHIFIRRSSLTARMLVSKIKDEGSILPSLFFIFFLIMLFNFVDSILPFRKKVKNLERLNMYQFLSQRYGIGSNLSKLIISHSGYSKEYMANMIPSNYISDKIRKLFVRSLSSLDNNLKEYMVKQIEMSIRMGCYKGVRHVFKYPCRGQRTRSNAKTRKRMSFQSDT